MSTPRNSRAIDLVIFDCDGVLVDSEVIASRAVAETLQAIGHAIAPEWVAERFAGMSNKDMYALLEREFGTLPTAFDAAMNRRAAAIFARELKAMAGVEAVLAGLTMRACVASSSTPEGLARKLEWTGLAGWFTDAVFSTAAVARGKPAPDIFLHVAKRLGVAPARALVIEDSLPGIAAAKAAGMTVFGFTGGSHCRPGHGERLAAAGAERVFAEMSLLPELIAQRNATFTTS
ncbi:MAG TPA: HAD family phosphatase [Stellaceae bacterium]|nr:HAD family phosphatase [Stellaceae bacterium]